MATKLSIIVIVLALLNSFSFADEYRQVPQGGGRMGTVLVRTDSSREDSTTRNAGLPEQRQLRTVARWAGTHFIGIVFEPGK